MATRRELLLEAARQAEIRQRGKQYRKGGPVATRKQEGLDAGGKRHVLSGATKPPTGVTAKQIAAYKAARGGPKGSGARGSMAGMLAAAGGDVSKLKAIHAAAYPSGSSLPKKNGATTTKTTTKTTAAPKQTPAQRRRALLARYGGPSRGRQG